MIDFQEENNIDFQPEIQNDGIDFEPTLKGKVEYNISNYDAVLQDDTLTKKQKAQRIKEIGEAERKDINNEHLKKMAKLYGGTALEIGSAAIPFGGVANLGGRLALKIAKPAFSQIAKKVVAKNIGSGIASGLTSGAIFGAGEGLMNDNDINGIAHSTLEGAGAGAVGGGLIGGVASKLATKFGKTNKVINRTKSRTDRLAQNPKNNYGHAESEVRKLLQIRRNNIDSAKFDALQKIENFSSQIDDIAKELNLDSKGLREVLPFIRENTDLPVQNFNRPDLEQIYNGLNQDQKEVLRMIAQKNFDEMETYWNNLAEAKNLKSSMSPYEYITHIWDLSEGEQKALQEYYEQFKTKTDFEKARKIPTYKEGIENGFDVPQKGGKDLHIDLKPKTLDYAEIQKLHSHQLIDAAENSKFMQKLQEIQANNPDYAEELENLAKPFIDNKKETEVAKTTAGRLLQEAGNAYDMVNNFAKGCKFLFNGMHAVALTESASAHEGLVPIKTFKTLGNLPKIIEGIKSNNYEAFKKNPAVKQAVQDGVQFGEITDINIGNFNTFIDGVSKLVDKVSFGTGKVITKPLQAFINANNKFLWNYLHNTYKLNAYQTLIKRVSKNGKKTLSDDVRKEIGQLVNDTFGGQNWEGLGIKPDTLKNAKRLFLSPDWNMSATVRQSLAVFSSEAGQKFLNEFANSSKFGTATRELSRKLGLSSFTNNIEGAGIRGKVARKYFMTFLIQTAIYSNLINACSRAVDKHFNPEKYEEGINYSSYSNNRFTENDGTGKKVVSALFPRPYVGNDKYGRELYARTSKQALEVPELIEDLPNSAIRKVASKTAPLISPVATKLSDDFTDNWNKASIKDRYKDVLTPFTFSKNKDDFHPINFLYPTSKGLNAYKAREYLKECILNGDTDAIENFKPIMKANKLDFDRQIYRVYKELEQEQNGNRRN